MRRDAPPAALALLAIGALFLAVFVSRFHPAAALAVETARPAVAALLVILASYATGGGAIVVARRIINRSNDDEPRIADALLIGYTTFGTLIAIVSWISTKPVVPLTIVAAVVGAWIASHSSPSSLILHPSSLTVRSLLLLIPAAIAIVGAITPVNSPDELIYKLAVPHQYLLHGRMLELPLSSNSYLTLAAHFTDMAALALGGGIAAKLARVLVFFAAVAVIERLARRLAGDAATWITAVVAWTPALMLIAGWAWDEWLVVGLLVLSFERWLHDDDALSFAALGCAVATKFTALPWAFAFAIVIWLRRRNVRALAHCALLGVLVGGFFYLRNFIWTGSPFAPLLLPNAPAVENYRSGGRFSGWSDLVHGYDIIDPGIIDESLGIILPLAAVASLALLGRRDRATRELLIVGLVQMPILLTIAPASRNMIDGVLPLAIAGSLVMIEAWRASSRPLRALLATAAGAALFAQLALVAYSLESYDVAPYLAGREDAAAYIARTRAFARPFAWLASSTSADARVLLLGENRTFYLERQAIGAGNLDGPRVAAWLARFPSPDAFAAALRRERITHVVIGLANYRVGRAPLKMIEKENVLQLTPAVDAVVRATMQSRARLRYRDEGYLIFELR